MKTDNVRKFPGEHGPRPDRNEWKRKQAKELEEAWRKLSPAQQLKELDARLGEGVGAAKQRARIQRRLNARTAPVAQAAQVEVAAEAETKSTKPKAKDRRAAEQAATARSK